MSDQIVPTCDHLAGLRWRKQANGKLKPCVREPNHKGNHVYYLHIHSGMDKTSSAGEFLEEISLDSLKPIIHADLRGKRIPTKEERAALWAMIELQRHNNNVKG